MKHFALEHWLAYTRQELPERERTKLEVHLETCEACMELYIQSVEQAADAYPRLMNEAVLVDRVMESIHAERLSKPDPLGSVIEINGKESSSRWSGLGAWTRHPIFHYAVAAAITMLLLSSGLFQSLAEGEGAVDPLPSELTSGGSPNEPLPVSQQLLNKTIVMLDSIQPKQDRGGIR